MSNLEKINQLENQVSALQKEIEKLKKEQSFQRVLKNGDGYWTIGNKGVTPALWRGDEYDRFRLSIDNIYHTKEQAQFEIEKRRVITELKQYSRDFVAHECNYEFYFNYDRKAIVYDWSIIYKNTSLYFQSEEIARQAVEAVGRERVLKYYLGVRD